MNATTNDSKKAIRLREYSDQFEEALFKLKEIYGENVKTKTVERAVIECLELRRENAELKTKLNSLEQDHRSLLDYIMQYANLEDRKARLMNKIQDFF
ncbi:MAG: hypothetical protein AAF849_04915 [Bacteroidota bacterium]